MQKIETLEPSLMKFKLQHKNLTISL